MDGKTIILSPQTFKKSLSTDFLKSDANEEKEFGVLCFILGDEEFGIDLNLLNQIVIPPPITWVPRVKPYILGIISIRGDVVTLVDTRQLLSLEPSKISKTSRVLLMTINDEHVGVLVDAVTLVRRIPLSTFEENPSLDENKKTNKILGIVRPDKKTQITIIDLMEILAEALQ